MLLARNGKAEAVIDISADPKRLMPQARELRRVLKEMTGASFEIAKVSGACPAMALAIRPSLLLRYKRRIPKILDAVAWKCDGRARLEIAGSGDGALWLALYAFLEERLGCRWFFPGRAGEDIPRRERLSVGRLNTVKTPSYITRQFSLWPVDFQRKKLTGGPPLRGIHTYSAIAPKSVLMKHPTYAVMIDGKRLPKSGYQLCLSRKGVEGLAVRYCLDDFEKNPDELTVGVCPNDGENFCDCPRCVETNLGRKPEKGEENPWWVTRSVFDFTNRVAARTAATHPDKLILTIAYSRTKKPPENLKLRDNVMVDYCSQPESNWQGKGARKILEDEITAWTRCAKHVGIYDYILNQSWPGLVRPLTGIISHELKFFYKKGVRYYFTQHANDFGVNMANYYLLAALLWDVNRDPAGILDDMYKRCFRKAGPAVKKYFEIMEAAIMDKAMTGPGPATIDITGHRNAHENVCAIFTPGILARAGAALDRAARLARGDAVAMKRLDLVLKAFKYLRAAVRAARLSYDFTTKYRVKSFTPWAWNVGNYDYHNTLEKMEMFGKPCVRRFRELMHAWREYRALRLALEKEMVLTPHYSRGGRSFDPKDTLDNIWGLYTGRLKKVPLLVKAHRVLRAM